LTEGLGASEAGIGVSEDVDRNQLRAAATGQGIVRLVVWCEEVLKEMVDWRRSPGTTSPMHLGLKVRALCAPTLVPFVISRGPPRQATLEVSVSEERNRARNGRQILPVIPTSM
jgi:hypothetical protein